MRKLMLLLIAALALTTAAFVVAQSPDEAEATPAVAADQPLAQPLAPPGDEATLLESTESEAQVQRGACGDHSDPCPPEIPDCNSCNTACSDFGGCMSCCTGAFSACMGNCDGSDITCFQQCRQNSRTCRSGCSTLPF